MTDRQTYQDLLDKIHQLEENQRLLRKKTERLELAIDTAEDGVWDWDPRTGITYFSPRWLTMLGYEPGELPSSYATWLDLLHPEDRENAVNTVSRFLETPDKLFSIEFRMRTKDHGWRWIHARGKKIAVDRQGKISRVIGTHVDITERKRLESSLRLTRFIYERASIGIYRIASDARIIDVNEEAARSLGYSREELASLHIFDIDPLTNTANWPQIWQKLLDEGVNRFEAIHRRKDGTEIPVLITSNLLEYGGQQFSIAFVQDISSFKHMEQALFQAQKMEAIGNLAGGIAHDFNNVLSAIYGYAQLAQLEENGNDKVREYIRRICLASERAKEMIMQILAFSRQGISEKHPTDIGKIIRDVLKLVRASIPATVEIQKDIAVAAGPVRANQTQLHQLVMNLCINAAHALQGRNGKISVELTPVTLHREEIPHYQDLLPGRYLKLIIADNGHGIDPAVLPRIFEPYFTTKEHGEGTGMGLAMVHGIVRDHGGDIKVYSEVGIGTTVQVLFPVVDENPEPVSETAGVLPTGTERILYVDDEQFIVEIGKELLGSLGYSVEIFTSPPDCLAAFRSRPDDYDLIITDFAMPLMDGEKLIAEARRIRRSIPVILCTGFGTNVLSERLTALGIESVLMKPVSAVELATAVRKTIDSGRAADHPVTAER